MNGQFSALEIGAIAVDLALPDPVPGLPGPVTAAILAKHGIEACRIEPCYADGKTHDGTRFGGSVERMSTSTPPTTSTPTAPKPSLKKRLAKGLASGIRASGKVGSVLETPTAVGAGIVGGLIGGSLATSVGGPVGTALGGAAGGYAGKQLVHGGAKLGRAAERRALAALGEDDDTKAEALRAPRRRKGASLKTSCLRTTGEIVIRGESSKTCRAPKTDSQAWARMVEQAKETLSRMGVELGKQLGCGTYGCAFEVIGRKDVVVKVTGDRAEVAALRAVAEAVADGRTTWRKLSAVAKPFCVYGLLDDCDRPLPVYIIVQERMAGNLGPLESVLVNEYWTLILDLAEGKEDEQKLRDWVAWTLGKTTLKQLDSLIRSVAELARIDVHWTDLHSGNVLKDAKGAWKIVDLGFSRSPDTTIGTLRAPQEEEEVAEALPSEWADFGFLDDPDDIPVDLAGDKVRSLLGNLPDPEGYYTLDGKVTLTRLYDHSGRGGTWPMEDVDGRGRVGYGPIKARVTPGYTSKKLGRSNSAALYAVLDPEPHYEVYASTVGGLGEEGYRLLSSGTTLTPVSVPEKGGRAATGSVTDRKDKLGNRLKAVMFTALAKHGGKATRKAPRIRWHGSEDEGYRLSVEIGTYVEHARGSLDEIEAAITAAEQKQGGSERLPVAWSPRPDAPRRLVRECGECGAREGEVHRQRCPFARPSLPERRGCGECGSEGESHFSWCPFERAERFETQEELPSSDLGPKRLIEITRRSGESYAVFSAFLRSGAKAQSRAKNKEAHGALVRAVQSADWQWYNVVGGWPDETGQLWLEEKSLLLRDITFEEARDLSKKSRQQSFVWRDSSGTLAMYDHDNKQIIVGMNSEGTIPLKIKARGPSAVRKPGRHAGDLYTRVRGGWSFEYAFDFDHPLVWDGKSPLRMSEFRVPRVHAYLFPAPV